MYKKFSLEDCINREQAEDYICLICQDLLNEPKECKVCRKHFCKICTEKWQKEKNQCPNKCSNGIWKLQKIRNKEVISELKKSIVKCKEISCVEQFSILDSGKHLKKCSEQLIDCPNLGCLEKFLKKNLDQHIKECQFNLVTKDIKFPSYKERQKLKDIKDFNDYFHQLLNQQKNEEAFKLVIQYGLYKSKQQGKWFSRIEMYLADLGRVFKCMNKNYLACLYFDRCLYILENVTGNKSFWLIDKLNAELSYMKRNLFQFPAAIEHQKRCIQIRKNILIKDPNYLKHKDVKEETSRELCDLGALCCNIGLLSESEEYLHESLSIKQQQDRNNPQTSLNYYNLSVLYRYKGQFSLALEYAYRSLEIIEQKNEDQFQQKKKPDLIYVLSCIQYKLGNHEKANELLAEYKKVAKTYQNKHALYYQYARGLIKQQKYEKALQILQNCEQEFEKKIKNHNENQQVQQTNGSGASQQTNQSSQHQKTNIQQCLFISNNYSSNNQSINQNNNINNNSSNNNTNIIQSQATAQINNSYNNNINSNSINSINSNANNASNNNNNSSNIINININSNNNISQNKNGNSKNNNQNSKNTLQKSSSASQLHSQQSTNQNTYQEQLRWLNFHLNNIYNRMGLCLLNIENCPKENKQKFYLKKARVFFKEKQFKIEQAVNFKYLSQYYFNKNKTQKALEYMQEALKLRIQLYTDQSVRVAVYYIKLGKLYFETNSFDNAYSYTLDGIKVMKQQGLDLSIKLLKAEYQLGLILLEQGKCQESYDLYKEALERSKEIKQQNLSSFQILEITIKIYQKLFEISMKYFDQKTEQFISDYNSMFDLVYDSNASDQVITKYQDNLIQILRNTKKK